MTTIPKPSLVEGRTKTFEDFIRANTSSWFSKLPKNLIFLLNPILSANSINLILSGPSPTITHFTAEIWLQTNFTRHWRYGNILANNFSNYI